MRQIADRGYAKKFAGSGKTVYQAAFAFLGRDDIEMRATTDNRVSTKLLQDRIA
jgi:hypothetical protein